MPVKLVFSTQGSVPVKVWTDEIQSEAITQLKNLATMPFLHHHVAGMIDVHAGRGSTVGSVIPTRGAIIPAGVGVDLGCGVNALQLNITADMLPDSLESMRLAIERVVPLGAGGAHQLYIGGPATMKAFEARFELIKAKHPGVNPRTPGKWEKQLGTLGSGNHFIELCLDETDHVWVMLHSGSRGIGNIIGSYFIEKAKEEMHRRFIKLPDPDLAYLVEGDPVFDDYIEAVDWAQDYAMENRRVMMRNVFKVLERYFPDVTSVQEAVNCHHNYIAREHHYGANVWITRKGAIRAREGDLGVIPGSMGAKSYVVRGLGNPESFCSCSHGAGRKMSRSEAKRLFTIEDLKAQTVGIECRKDAGVIDEIPGAYKNLEKGMEYQNDLVEIKHTLRQVLNVKG